MNLVFLRDGGRLPAHGVLQAVRTRLAMLELGAGMQPGSPEGETGSADTSRLSPLIPYLVYGPDAEQYLAATESYGSPAYSLDEIRSLPPELRNAADMAGLQTTPTCGRDGRRGRALERVVSGSSAAPPRSSSRAPGHTSGCAGPIRSPCRSSASPTRRGPLWTRCHPAVGPAWSCRCRTEPLNPGRSLLQRELSSRSARSRDRCIAATARRPAGTEEPSQFPLFDSLRALAAISILVVHVGIFSGVYGNSWYGPYIANLDIGVPFFFLLSAFLLYRPFVAARVEGRDYGSLLTYARRRFIRIVPAYWAVLTISAVVPGMAGAFSSNWWVYYGLLQNYPIYTGEGNCSAAAPNALDTFRCGVPPAWSLAVEVMFYAALPVFALAAAWLGRRWKGRNWLVPEFTLIGVISCDLLLDSKLVPGKGCGALVLLFAARARLVVRTRTGAGGHIRAGLAPGVRVHKPRLAEISVGLRLSAGSALGNLRTGCATLLLDANPGLQFAILRTNQTDLPCAMRAGRRRLRR